MTNLTGRRVGKLAEAFLQVCRRSSRKPTLCNHFSDILRIANSHIENFCNEESLSGLLPLIVLESWPLGHTGTSC